MKEIKPTGLHFLDLRRVDTNRIVAMPNSIFLESGLPFLRAPVSVMNSLFEAYLVFYRSEEGKILIAAPIVGGEETLREVLNSQGVNTDRVLGIVELPISMRDRNPVNEDPEHIEGHYRQRRFAADLVRLLEALFSKL